MSSAKPNSRKAHGTPDAKDPAAGRPSPQAAGRADEPASSSAEPSATGAVKVKSYEKSEGTIRQVGSARIEYLHDTDYVVTGALSANQYVLVSDHGKGKAELWMGHKNRPSGYCIQYGPLYLEFVRSLSSEEKGDAKPVREPALKFKKLVPGVRVRVVDGSGLDSGREGVIVPNSEAHRLNRQPAGKPSWKENPYGTQYGEPGRYKDFDPSRELIVKDDAGNYFGMFKSRLISVEDYLAQKSMDPTVKPEIPQTSHEWGLANRIRETGPVECVWGARALWRGGDIGILADRQEAYGGEDCQRKALHAWINAVGLPWLQATAPDELDPAQRREIEFKQRGFRLIADSNASHGHLYIAASMPKSQDTAGASWSGKGPIPSVGTRVTVRMNGFGEGTVVGHFVEEGWAGVRVHLDTLPGWFVRQEKEQGRGACPIGKFFGADLAPVKE
jgi:hypothetical protein